MLGKVQSHRKELFCALHYKSAQFSEYEDQMMIMITFSRIFSGIFLLKVVGLTSRTHETSHLAITTITSHHYHLTKKIIT